MGTPLQQDASDGREGISLHSAGAPPDNDVAPRLTPAMSSRKLQALYFIKDYYRNWAQSPTLGEIAGHLRISKKRAYDLVEQLARDGMIERVRGKARSIRLLDRAEELTEADVLRRLQALGWTVAIGSRMLQPPPLRQGPGQALRQAQEGPLTKKGLPPLPRLDHDFGDEGVGPG